MRVTAIIPALDEEGAIGGVVRGLLEEAPSASVELRILVVDNGSRDQTAERARSAGAEVILQPERGYGAACLAGIEASASSPPDAVLFVDGDGACDPKDMARLLEPIRNASAELVIGSRVRHADPDSLTLPQRFGNVLATTLINRIHGSQFSDLGPYRAIRWDTLQSLGMQDRDYGWTVEMQLEAARRGVATVEVDVRHRVRAAGRSKVAGTVRGVMGAGSKILWTIGRLSLLPRD
ncbi:MAG: glycosyltransferase family 2 protein [Myxococcota bacterium]